MAQLQALLKIVADVVGEEKVEQLSRTMGRMGDTAGRVSGGLKGMLGAAGGLSGALGALAPAVTGVGLASMAKGAIDAADDMNDLSQKTGVSVEQLSRFKQAADASGTSIEGVGNSMVKLNRNLATGNAGAANALRDLGISATDASGALKSADQIMLEVADRFAAMPDGAQKSASAMALFGKSGADMVPLLNGGSQAVKGLSATMTGDFARGADSLNDKLVMINTKLAILGTQIASTLMPHIEALASGIESALTAFSELPGPVQSVVFGFGVLIATLPVLTPLLWSIATVAGVIAGIKLGATIAGWAYLIGPAIVGIKAAFTGLIAFFTGTIAPALIAFFSGPAGWTILAIAAVVAMAIAFRKPITDFVVWIAGEFMKLAKSVGTWLQPIGQALSNLWTASLKVAGEFFAGVGRLAQGMVQAVRAPFEALGGAIRALFNGILGAIERSVNGAVNAVNTLIHGYNMIPTAPDLPLIPNIEIPRFAQGGVVDRPTVAMVGEGGEREYIIPESKMAAASARYLAGARGGGVIGPSSINITTGPVMQQDGQRWVSLSDLERAMRQTEASTLARIRTPAGRRALGVR